MKLNAFKTELMAAIAESRSDEDFRNRWLTLSEKVRQSPEIISHHKELLAHLQAIDKPKEDICILEHGCGRGLTLFFLIAMGYKNVWGIDIHRPLKEHSRWLRAATGEREGAADRLQIYNGHDIPFPNSFFDFTYSQQVLEHVLDRDIVAYYAEEGRVLKPGGAAYHQVPHRLVPFESHTQTWFIHWLPRPLAEKIFARRGLAESFSHVYLRWPWVHRELVTRHIGPTKELTANRVAKYVNNGEFKGITATARKAAAVLANMPVAGYLFKRIFSGLIMAETISYKS